VAGLKAMGETHPTLTVSDGSRQLTGQLVLVGNGMLYGGSYRIFPGAQFHDGQLDVCVFPKVNWLTLARCGTSLLLRHRLPEASVRRLQANAFTISSERPARFEVDGELGGKLPARFSVRQKTLRVLTR